MVKAPTFTQLSSYYAFVQIFGRLLNQSAYMAFKDSFTLYKFIESGSIVPRGDVRSELYLLCTFK